MGKTLLATFGFLTLSGLLVWCVLSGFAVRVSYTDCVKISGVYLILKYLGKAHSIIIETPKDHFTESDESNFE